MKNCQTKISNSCIDNFYDSEMDNITACQEAASTYGQEVDVCLRKFSIYDSCLCFIDLPDKILNEVIACNLADKNEKMTELKLACAKGISYYKKFNVCACV